VNGPESADRLPRPLDPVEVRVVGALLEKEQTTPDAYPLTVNALVAACNQKTNRDPVMSLEETEVEAALERLLQDVFVWRSSGARTERWQVNVERRWGLRAADKAVMTLLLLRGPQTPGELRSRSGRLHDFADPAAVEDQLRALAAGREPLVVELARAPGQKENRWMHLVGGPLEEDAQEALAAGPAPVSRDLTARGTPAAFPASPGELEARLGAVERRLARLERELGLQGSDEPHGETP
jgi:uncharacterized protein YceH (UPF0502 family)